MTDIEEQALALVNEGRKVEGWPAITVDQLRSLYSVGFATARIAAEKLNAEREAHEAYKREVSDAMLLLQKYLTGSGWGRGDRIDLLEITGGGSVNFDRFILPKPVDPLVEAIKACGFTTVNSFEPEFAACLRTALAARGLEIVEKNP